MEMVFCGLRQRTGLSALAGTVSAYSTAAAFPISIPASGRTRCLPERTSVKVMRIYNGQAEWTPPPPPLRQYEHLLYDDTTGIYAAVGLPNIYEGYLRIKKYIIPVDGNTGFHISGDTVSFMDGGRAQYHIPYPNSNPWRFFTIGGRLYHMAGKKGSLLRSTGIRCAR